MPPNKITLVLHVTRTRLIVAAVSLAIGTVAWLAAVLDEVLATVGGKYHITVSNVVGMALTGWFLAYTWIITRALYARARVRAAAEDTKTSCN
ncbi:hypothetical protein ACH4VR_36185 [Streptomyces sp. NPDC020883]|uniref:hypothetical protein n=1 Tax=Streptomyces sp. NPDC020883 TaxID=3365099 RepID=UPI0037A631C1